MTREVGAAICFLGRKKKLLSFEVEPFTQELVVVVEEKTPLLQRSQSRL